MEFEPKKNAQRVGEAIGFAAGIIVFATGLCVVLAALKKIPRNAPTSRSSASLSSSAWSA